MTEKLHRSKRNKILAGVCGGIAEYFKVDVTLIRLAWVLAVFFGGSGIVLYILAIVIIPEEVVEKNTTGTLPEVEIIEGENSETIQPESVKEKETKRRQIFGIILVGLGAYFLLERFFRFNMHDWWPVILIVIGAVLLFKSIGGENK